MAHARVLCTFHDCSNRWLSALERRDSASFVCRAEAPWHRHWISCRSSIPSSTGTSEHQSPSHRRQSTPGPEVCSCFIALNSLTSLKNPHWAYHWTRFTASMIQIARCSAFYINKPRREWERDRVRRVKGIISNQIRIIELILHVAAFEKDRRRALAGRGKRGWGASWNNSNSNYTPSRPPQTMLPRYNQFVLKGNPKVAKIIAVQGGTLDAWDCRSSPLCHPLLCIFLHMRSVEDYSAPSRSINFKDTQKGLQLSIIRSRVTIASVRHRVSRKIFSAPENCDVSRGFSRPTCRQKL